MFTLQLLTLEEINNCCTNKLIKRTYAVEQKKKLNEEMLYDKQIRGPTFFSEKKKKLINYVIIYII